MKKILFTLLSICFIQAAYANKNYKDTVYMKNGDVIVGDIFYYVPSKMIKIMNEETYYVFLLHYVNKFITDKNIDRYQVYDRADSIKNKYDNLRENKQNLQAGAIQYQQKPKFHPLKYKKNIFLAEFGVGVGFDYLKLQVYDGIRINPYFSLGAGAGVRQIIDTRYYPLLADIRVNLYPDVRQMVTFGLNMGYTYHEQKGFEYGGFTFSPSVNLCWNIRKNFNPNFRLEYEYQQNILLTSTHGRLSTLGIALGLIF